MRNVKIIFNTDEETISKNVPDEPAADKFAAPYYVRKDVERITIGPANEDE